MLLLLLFSVWEVLLPVLFFVFLFFQSLHHKQKRLLPAHVFCAHLTAIERIAFTSYLIYFLLILLFITAILKMLVLSRILLLKLEKPYLRPRHFKCHSWAGVVCLLNSFSDYTQRLIQSKLKGLNLYPTKLVFTPSTML